MRDAPPTGLRERAGGGRGLLGSGLATAADGTPLRPGGRAVTVELLDWAAFSPGDVVLDVGCGQGASVELMAGLGLRAVGIDIAAAPIALAARRAGSAAFVVANGENLPLRSSGADGVVAECSLSVMAQRRRALTDWFRVLRSGGRLAMSDIYRRRVPGAGTEATGMPALASWPSIAGDITAAGFRIIRFEDRSDVLKSWVARFIFAYGSLDALWQDCCGLTVDDARASAPGYFVMIADKPSDGPVEERR